MTLQLVEGEYYRTADGDKVGPMQKWASSTGSPWQEVSSILTSTRFSPRGDIWSDAGIGSAADTPDLVSLWNGEPTMQEVGPVCMVPKIMPGLYGRVKVNDPGEVASSIDQVTVSMYGPITADELEAAAATLTSLSKALREMKE